MKGYYVEVRVGPVLKQYTEHSLNMDIIRPGQGSILVDLMRPYLERRNYEQLDLFGGDDSSAPTDNRRLRLRCHSITDRFIIIQQRKLSNTTACIGLN